MVQTVRSKRISELRQRLVPADAAAEQLQGRVDSRAAASAIRLGDGEGVLLSARGAQERVCLASHFGPTPGKADLDRLRQALLEAVAQADIIGVRPDMLSGVLPAGSGELDDRAYLEMFRRVFALRPAESRLIDISGARRLGQLHAFLCQHALPPAAVITHAWCHFAWSASGQLAHWIGSAPRIGLVTSRRGLAEIFARFGRPVDVYRVPEKFADRGPGWTAHFPDRYARLFDELQVRCPGQVFLVGAGICGKVYCHWIKQRGGIGIDAGSVCDAWLGLASRRLVLETLFGSARVPPQLLLEAQLARLLPRPQRPGPE